jgi:hypothetical protein
MVIRNGKFDEFRVEDSAFGKRLFSKVCAVSTGFMVIFIPYLMEVGLVNAMHSI